MDLEQLLPQVGYDLAKAFVGTLLALIVFTPIKRWWDHRQFGGWNVLVTRGGEVLVDRSIGTAKAREILDDESALSVFLKGIVSPFEFVQMDLVTKGQECGLLTRDTGKRTFQINLDKHTPTGEADSSEAQPRDRRL